MKIITIVGARPQFIKAGVVSNAIAHSSTIKEIVIHTGQHYDSNMSNVFFEQLSIPHPQYQLNIHGCKHGEMTGKMLIEIEKIFLNEKPERVIVYGDTNSTLAGALAASKLHIPVAHIEAGLRSFNMRMPEEINRVLTDQVSDILFCPTLGAVQNLVNEGFNTKSVEILNVGDVMQDSAIRFERFAQKPIKMSIDNGFVLATLHRAENTDDPDRIMAISEALNEIQRSIVPVVLPLHPRTRLALAKARLNLEVRIIDPVGYLEMLWLLKHCGLVLTDSGGLQKEAFFFGKPCITTRDQTEWKELVDLGVNEVVGADKQKIIAAVEQNLGRKVENNQLLYGGGKTAERIVERLSEVRV